MEFILVTAILLLSAGGLGIGLALTGRPPRDACSAMACEHQCEVCPRRKALEANDD